MVKVCERTFLIYYDQKKGPTELRHLPEGDVNVPDFQSFLCCSFPEANLNCESVYSFSIANSLCHTWVFQCDNNIYSIVIMSRNCLSYYFLEFLKSCRRCLKGKNQNERFDKVNELLGKWDFNENLEQIHIFHVDSEFTTSIGMPELFYQQFEPTAFISTDKKILEDVCRSLLTGRGVLFIGDTPEMVSSAGYALMSLLEPLKFRDDFLLYTKFGDQRFADIINGETKWKFVCTTNRLALKRCKQFKTIVEIPKKSNKIIPEVKESISKRFIRLLTKIEVLLDRNLDVNPYFDGICKSFTNDEINSIVPSFGFKFKDFQLFFKTNTYKDWRRSITKRPHLREALLSNSPQSVVAAHTDEELKVAESFLKEIFEIVKQDEHLNAVISLHLKLIRKRFEDKQE